MSQENIATAETKPTEATETFAFSADINQLLSLIVNTFYSNKDIFLRELISNASDALDKVRYNSLTDSTLLQNNPNTDIRIYLNKNTNQLIIEDDGIGMTQQDLINNLGTIAKSGTKSFLESLDKNANSNLIGQFGVGFYSAYLVSDLVTVISRHAQHDKQYRWESAAGGSFTVSEDNSQPTIERGTRVILNLKDECSDYLNEERIEQLVKRHSDFINFPIYLEYETTRSEEVSDEAEPKSINDANANDNDTVNQQDIASIIENPTVNHEMSEENHQDINTEISDVTDTVNVYNEDHLSNHNYVAIDDVNNVRGSGSDSDSDSFQDSASDTELTVGEDRLDDLEKSILVNDNEEIFVSKNRNGETKNMDQTIVEEITDAEIGEVKEETSINDAEPEAKKKTVTKKEYELRQINNQTPLWVKSPEDISSEDYNSFYKKVSSDYADPASVKHFHIEGQLDYFALLFLPSKAPYQMFNTSAEEKNENIKLFVRRVFVSDIGEKLCPEWLNFISGIIDSEDLPLNVSRESLQQSRILRVIKKTIIKKSIEMIKDYAEQDETKYLDFYKEFSRNIKLGIHEDENYKDKLATLLRFNTTTSETNQISLDKYIENMPGDQKKIYYISGESIQSLTNSPFLEQYKKKGYEVLFLTEAIDEYMIPALKTYRDFEVQNIAASNESLGFVSEEDKQVYRNTCDLFKDVLSGEIERVEISNRLADSPCVVVADKYGVTANMERLMKAQTMQSNNMMSYISKRRVLEINPENKIIKKIHNDNLNYMGETNCQTRDLVWLLFENSLLSSGYTLDDPTRFSKRINNLIHLGLGLDEDEDDDIEYSEDNIGIDDDGDDDDDENMMEQVD
tara:strand:+ start:817 stop:3375 length:2559 start_codon:yes stop_codon:yes gene_type:complete